ncbi:MAG TPA: aconitase X catalytic domain-containing protein [Anaerolineales bacterium]|nr:aconitase X catalytic domain-containing protein [Anaerolineales bacterium]
MSKKNHLILSGYDRELLAGERGPGAQMAMRIIVRIAEILGVERLIDIEAAHIDSSLYMGQATLEFAEKLVDLGAKVAVPSTLNVSGVDEHGWMHWSVPQDWAEKAQRQMRAYQEMGCIPTWTCAPYQTEFKPKFGQQIAWGESNAIVFANSIIGARTERYPDLLDICAAITARVPAAGLHLEENRAGHLLLRLREVPERVQRHESFYPVLGHLMGKIAGEKNPVVVGMEVHPEWDQLKALGAAAASSGTVGLFHLVGITPEAPTLEAAFHGNEPEQEIDVTMDDLREAWKELSTAEGRELDLVVLGCPHFSLAEFARLGRLFDGKEKHNDVLFLVNTNRSMKALADEAGYLRSLEAFGGVVTVDTCPLATPMLSPEVEMVMTNSAKFAYYAPGILDERVVFGTLEDCVISAIDGRVVRDESLWRT